MSEVVSLINSLNCPNYNDLVVLLSQAPYFLECKESNIHSELFLITPTSKTDFSCPIYSKLYNNCIGPIFNKFTYKLVSHSFPRVLELNDIFDLNNMDQNELTTFYETQVKDVQVYEEGTFIRLYCHNDVWTVSTFRCIDTIETFIPSCKNLNFTNLFLEASQDIDFNKLNTCITYCFILKHSKHRCIIPYNGDPKLILVGECNNDTYTCNYNTDFSYFLITKVVTEKVHNTSAKSYSKALCESNKVKNVCYNITSNKKVEYNNINNLLSSCITKTNVENKGYFLNLHNGSRVSILYEEFNRLQKLRGNNPSIYIRYLELSVEDRLQLIKNFNMNYNLKCIDSQLNKKIHEIYSMYKAVNIYKSLKLESCGRCNRIIYQLHSQYLKTRTPINIDTVKNKFNSLLPKTIGWLMEWI